MGEGKSSFRRAVDEMIVAAGNDTTDALCQLSRAQQAFDEESLALRQRMATLDKIPADQQADEDLVETAVPSRLLHVLWLAIVAGAMVAFAAGFWIGRYAH
jgi:hypothetical protein